MHSSSYKKAGLGREGDVGDIFAWDIIMSPLNYMKEKLTSPPFLQHRRFFLSTFSSKNSIFSHVIKSPMTLVMLSVYYHSKRSTAVKAYPGN